MFTLFKRKQSLHDFDPKGASVQHKSKTVKNATDSQIIKITFFVAKNFNKVN